MRGRGFVSLGIIVSKLHVRYFQPGTGTATSASITLLFLFSYVFHFPADHPFNNPPSPLPFIPAVLRVRANLVTKKTRNFPNQRTFLKRSRISISDDFPRVRGGGREREGRTEHFYAFVQTRTTVNTCLQTMNSNYIPCNDNKAKNFGRFSIVRVRYGRKTGGKFDPFSSQTLSESFIRFIRVPPF